MNARAQHRLPGSGSVMLLIVLFLYVPLMILVVLSFNAGSLMTRWEGFSLEWYRAALSNSDLKRATLNSLIVATTAASAATLLALCAALALQQKERPLSPWLRHSTSSLILLPLMLPEIVMAVGTLMFFSAAGINLGLGNVMIAHTVFCLPFAYGPIRARLQGIPPSLAAAARDLYATPFDILRYVTWPLLRPGVIAGFLLAFITSLDDFIITQLVAPPGAMTLPVYIYGMVRRGITPEINAVSTLLLTVSVVLVVLAYRFHRART